MKRSYDRSLLYNNAVLQTREVLLERYPDIKYECYTSDDIVPEIQSYTGLKSWDIIEGGFDAEEIESTLEAANMHTDKYHEYLVLHFNTGEVLTFNNSEVDMFIM